VIILSFCGGFVVEKKKKNRTFVEAEVVRKSAFSSSFGILLSRLNDLNEMIFVYCNSIKEMQEVSHGSLIPHLQVCKKEGCLGCQHVRWKRWYDPLKDQRKRQRNFGKKVGEVFVESRFQASDITNPLQQMPRGEEFRELRETIKAFESLRKQRKDMVRHLTNALRCTSSLDS